MTIAIEPMVTLGKGAVRVAKIADHLNRRRQLVSTLRAHSLNNRIIS